MPAPTPKEFPLRHIAIEGPIGVGKTSLVGLLAKRFSGTQILEDVTNPFLADFYAGKKGAAFQTQIYFLLSRFQQQQEIAQIDLFKNLVVADYTFAKDKIFAYLTLNDSEISLYDKIYATLAANVPRPDIVVHLTASRRDLPFAHQEARPRVREGDLRRVPQVARRGLQLLLLPLPRMAAPRRRDERDRLRREEGRPRRPHRADHPPVPRDADLRAARLEEVGVGAVERLRALGAGPEILGERPRGSATA